MSDEFGTVQEATMHVRRADARWQEAVHSFDPYAERLRRLADAAEAERRALVFAELCNVPWQPVTGARGLRLAEDLDSGTRPGPDSLWAPFDQALERLGVALEGDGFAGVAEVFAAISSSATEIAGKLEQDPIIDTPAEPRRKTG
jgi:hypothetical protein